MKENFDAYVPHDSRRYFISDDFRSLCLRCYIYIHGRSRRRQRGSLIVVLVVQWAKQSKSVKTSKQRHIERLLKVDY